MSWRVTDHITHAILALSILKSVKKQQQKCTEKWEKSTKSGKIPAPKINQFLPPFPSQFSTKSTFLLSHTLTVPPAWTTLQLSQRTNIHVSIVRVIITSRDGGLNPSPSTSKIPSSRASLQYWTLTRVPSSLVMILTKREYPKIPTAVQLGVEKITLAQTLPYRALILRQNPTSLSPPHPNPMLPWGGAVVLITRWQNLPALAQVTLHQFTTTIIPKWGVNCYKVAFGPLYHGVMCH